MKRDKKSNKNKQNETPAPTLLVNNPSKWQSWWVRFRLSVIMILGFGVIIWIGHWGLVGLLLFLQIFGYRELSNIRAITMFGKGKSSKQGNLPYSSPWLDICLFFSVQYFFYGSLIFRQFPSVFAESEQIILRYLASYHTLICFSMMMFCLVVFVVTLDKSLYLQQFQYLTWSAMVLLIIVPSNFHVFNVFQGLFWFVLPVSLIICNDITAYIWGFFLGKHSLIQLSPKKTWEGFIGAFFSTVIFSFFIAEGLSHFDIMVCPATDIFGASECVRNTIFEPSIEVGEFQIKQVQIYAVFFGIFASTIAPFGGFLASGFKRAYGFKDFGDLIPGHGGIVDRMDCQVMMSAFTFVFYLNFVAGTETATGMMSTVLSLPLHQQLEILAKLKETLGQ